MQSEIESCMLGLVDVDVDLPVGHCLQLRCLATSWYLPPAHTLHVIPSGEYLPG